MTKVYQNTWLYFKASGDAMELLEHNLPMPNHFERLNANAYCLAWLISGYFHTGKGIAYLNDIIARLMLTMPIQRRIEEAPICKNEKVHELRAFQNAISLPANLKNKIDTSNRYQDATFWAIKLQAEKLIRTFDGWFNYDLLESWAKDNFVPDKENSTIRAKCRSVWHWYDKQDFKIPEGRTFKMSRTENAKRLNEQRKLDSKQKVLDAANTLFVKNKNGKLIVSKVAKEAEVNVKTAKKYLNEIGLI